MSIETSIKIKKFWYAAVASDGGVGSDWNEIQIGQREATVQFNGSDADVTNYKNVLGSILESATLKGDKTMNFQLADLSPAVIADFTGGTVTDDATSTKYEAPENENIGIEKSIRFLTDNNILFEMPRVSFDGYPTMNDDDLHYYQMNGTVLLPTKANTPSYSYDILKLADENDIESFDILVSGVTVLTGAATITAGTHTVVAEVANGTGLTTLAPTIGVSLGASLDPASGDSRDFTSALTYSVESANGTSQTWTVTITEAA